MRGLRLPIRRTTRPKQPQPPALDQVFSRAPDDDASDSIQRGQVDLGRYVLQESGFLGQGANSEVFKGFRKSDRLPVAIKRIRLSHLRHDADKFRENLERELNILKEMAGFRSYASSSLYYHHHPNIVRLLAVYDPDTDPRFAPKAPPSKQGTARRGGGGFRLGAPPRSPHLRGTGAQPLSSSSDEEEEEEEEEGDDDFDTLVGAFVGDDPPKKTKTKTPKKSKSKSKRKRLGKRRGPSKKPTKRAYNPASGSLYLITELCKGGDIDSFLRTYGVVGPILARHVLKQLGDAMRYLWGTHRVVHRDIKSKNILIAGKIPTSTFSRLSRKTPDGGFGVMRGVFEKGCAQKLRGGGGKQIMRQCVLTESFVASKRIRVRTDKDEDEDEQEQDEDQFEDTEDALAQHISIRLADFGLARKLQETERAQTMCGTLSFMAPEVSMSQPATYKMDLWSLGVFLFEVLFGRKPYLAQHMMALLGKHQDNIDEKRPTPFENPDDPFPEPPKVEADEINHDDVLPVFRPENRKDFLNAKHLIRWCLRYDPVLRPSYDEFMSHPFLETLEDRALRAAGYELRGFMAGGTFADVYLGSRVGESLLRPVAIKRIRKARPGSYRDTLLKREVEILKKVHHNENITTLFAHVETRDFELLVLEFCAGGTLAEYIAKEKKLDERRTSFILRQLTAALMSLNQQNCIHRDLKPDNVLLVEEDENPPRIRLCDFGLAKQIMSEADRLAGLKQTIVGSPVFVAPEVVKRSARQDEKVDVFSLGVLFYLMLFGKLPFKKASFREMAELYERQAGPIFIPDGISADARDLLSRMLQLDPRKRLSLEEVHSHEFVDLGIHKYFVYPQPLGSGTWGTVFKVRRHGDGHVFACKRVLKAKIEHNRVELAALKREMALMKEFSHPGVVKFEETFHNSLYYFIIMELCTGGSLKDYVERRGRRLQSGRKFLPEKHVRPIALQLAKAMNYLETNKIAHRDLKLANILLARRVMRKKPVFHVKLCDFGLARRVSASMQSGATVCGSFLYMPPEMILAYSARRRCPSFRIDQWSFGVTIFNLLTGYFPYEASSPDELVRKVRESRPEISVPRCRPGTPAHDFISGLLQVIPDRRMSWSEALRHPFVCGLDPASSVFENVPQSELAKSVHAQPEPVFVKMLELESSRSSMTDSWEVISGPGSPEQLYPGVSPLDFIDLDELADTPSSWKDGETFDSFVRVSSAGLLEFRNLSLSSESGLKGELLAVGEAAFVLQECRHPESALLVYESLLQDVLVVVSDAKGKERTWMQKRYLEALHRAGMCRDLILFGKGGGGKKETRTEERKLVVPTAALCCYATRLFDEARKVSLLCCRVKPEAVTMLGRAVCVLSFCERRMRKDPKFDPIAVDSVAAFRGRCDAILNALK